MPDTQSTQTDEPAKAGVAHHKTETVHTDYEKIVAAFAPIAKDFAPVVAAWRTAEAEKTKTTEGEISRRLLYSNVTMMLIVGCICGLAGVALCFNQTASAEKVVIGLLAFLGGFSARR